jgi:molybdenum cofactor biosynthesis enzyme MoaA
MARMLQIGAAVMIADEIESFGSVYPSLPNVDQSALPVACDHDLAPISHLRFDPVSACNARCVFCHSDFSGAIRHLAPDDLQRATSRPMPQLNVLAVGCAYEPLMGKFFERYPAVISNLRGKAKARIITNGLLLHRNDLTPWIDFGVEYVHVSVHSHIADVYEQTMRNGAKFEQLAKNLADTRAKFPDLKVRFVNVITKTNDIDIPGYCRWALDEIGVDQIDLYKAEFVESPGSGMPAYNYRAALMPSAGQHSEHQF